MLRFNGLSRLITSKSYALAFGRLNSTALHVRPKEFKEVKLLGTILTEPFTLNNGSKLLDVKTVKPDGHYESHRVLVGYRKLVNIVGDSLSIGQRVYISGDLDSLSFEVEGNKLKQSFVIHASELHICKLNHSDNANNKFTDINDVTILSQIATHIDHHDTYSAFNMCTHHIVRNNLLIEHTVDGQNEKTSYVRVFVRDKNIIGYLKNDLQKGDRVLVIGSMKTSIKIDINGKKRSGGYINATHINKVYRFSNVSEDTVDK